MAKVERLAGKLVQRVPLFFGFSPKEMKNFLDICKLGTQAKGDVICEYNSASNRLFILLEGELEVIGPEETVLATIKPITTVGEMGFICHKPRSATVRTANASRLLKVDYHQFEALVEGNIELRAKIYRNMVRILSDKLIDANDMVVRYKKLSESRSEGEDGSGSEEDSSEVVEEDGSIQVLRLFYELTGVEPTGGELSEDRGVYEQLRKDGYSDADIEYAVKWAVRNIPSIRRFNLVKLSVAEAFEDKWSI